jgi:FkbM family methyltransferase
MKVVATFLAHIGVGIKPLRHLIDTALRMDPRNATALGAKLRYASNEVRTLASVSCQDPTFLDTYGDFGKFSQAQLLQDVVSLHLRRHNETNDAGYFVEIGVGDGKHLSNTHLFEKHLAWNGLLVEPNPDFHAKIRENRDCALAIEAAFNEDGGSVNFLAQTAGEMSGLSSHTKKRRGGTAVEVLVETKRTEKIFEEASVPAYVDFMSVDTEGTEFEILSAIDFGKRQFGFIAVEHNYKQKKRNRVIELLSANGYERVFWPQSHIDDWFVPKATTSNSKRHRSN